MAVVSNTKASKITNHDYDTVKEQNSISNNNSRSYENYVEVVRALDRLNSLRDALAGYGANDSACLEECMPSGLVDYGARINRDTAITIENIHAIISEISLLLN